MKENALELFCGLKVEKNSYKVLILKCKFVRTTKIQIAF
jgi:hypothetical protein